ncbi:hypothetical protein PROFUN_00547 [Planoprotostelium fungivorum]|uniref:NadR/Ttd14 AAA domain-containing protein n=1 Tax=Planoprotostelium fungivorum TaxID=1890364 RepID=A0A2P6N143_9EUKA|nr:hypothetical protein PROFUN_00547 [Planoprotostelium fungivorum]
MHDQGNGRWDLIIITGGPCCGKTTLLKQIEQMDLKGIKVVHEMARAYIDEQLCQGRRIEEIRGNSDRFQEEVLRRKVEVEDEILYHHPAATVMMERGLPDSIAYAVAYHCAYDPEQLSTRYAREHPEIRSRINHHLPAGDINDSDGRTLDSFHLDRVSFPQYTAVLILDELPYATDYARTESSHEAKRIHDLLYEVYRRLDTPVHLVPPLAITERVQHVLQLVGTIRNCPK